MIFLATFRILAANIGVPAWTALQADLIPKSIRGRYYANRNMVCNISALLATVVATFLLGLRFPLNFQIIFGGAAVLGLTASYIFSTIDFAQSPPKPKQAGTTFRSKVKDFWRKWAPSGFPQLRGEFFDLELRGEFSQLVLCGLLRGGFGRCSRLLGCPFRHQPGHPGSGAALLGRLADVFGQKNVMLASGIGVVVLPLLWWGTRNAWFPFLIYAINGLAWGGYNLAAFNLLLEITPDDNRTVYVGGYNTLMGVAMAVGPLAGGFAAEIFGLRPLFLTSGLFRALGLYMFYRLVEDATQKRMGLKDLLPQGRSARQRPTEL